MTAPPTTHALAPAVQPLALPLPDAAQPAAAQHAAAANAARPLTLRTQHEAHRVLRERAVGWKH